MFYSRIRFPYSGQTLLPVPFQYLSQDHVEVYVDGVQKVPTWVTSATISVPDLANSTEILIKRNTPKSELIVGFTDGAILKGAALQTENLQLLFIAQEAIDDALDGIKLDESGIYKANSKRITEVADPVNDGDVVTLGFADGKYGGAVVDRAEEARDAAIAKANEALASANTALTRLNETKDIRDLFAGALNSTYDRFACFKRVGNDLVVDFTTPSDNTVVNASDYKDVFILSGSAQLSITPAGDLIIQL